MTTTPTWPSIIWTAIANAEIELHRLTVTLQGLRSASSAAAASLTPSPEFHPAAA